MKRHNIRLGLTVGLALTAATVAHDINRVDAWGNCTVRRGATYYSVHCQGTGTFHAEARCVDGDNENPYRDIANRATAPYGVSDDNCKFGFHPTTIYIYNG